MFATIPVVSHAQSCCAANAKFASFTAEDEFIRSHGVPLPYTGAAASGTMISFPTQSGGNASAYVVTSKKHPNKVLLMFHDFWGLNDYNKSTADKLSTDLEVTVCAIDLFDGKVPATRDDASKLAGGISPTRANAMIDGAVAYFGKDAHFGTIGWCMGGTWSMQGALRAGKQADACVIYYGMPETDEAKLKDLHAPVFGFFGNKDKWITPKVVTDFQAAMKKAGKQLSVRTYDAGHAFANPSDPNHDNAAAEDANKHAMDFLKRHLRLF